MKISYIIVAYKSELLIEDCVKSIIFFNQKEDFEIIVVDNSPPEQQFLIKKICNKFQEFIIYIPNENKGYGHGNNIGIREAVGDIICIINPDVRFIEPFTNYVRESFSKDTKLGLLGLKQIGGYDLSFYLNPQYYFPFLSTIIIKLFNKINKYNPKFFFLSGACFFISRRKFLDVGLFDENLFMYYEEADINHRLRGKGHTIRYHDDIKYVHLIGDRKVTSNNLFEYELQSLKYYLGKYAFNIKRIFFFKKIEYFLISKHKYKILLDFINRK